MHFYTTTSIILMFIFPISVKLLIGTFRSIHFSYFTPHLLPLNRLPVRFWADLAKKLLFTCHLQAALSPNSCILIQPDALLSHTRLFKAHLSRSTILRRNFTGTLHPQQKRREKFYLPWWTLQRRRSVVLWLTSLLCTVAGVNSVNRTSTAALHKGSESRGLTHHEI